MVLDAKSQKNIQLMLEFFNDLFLALLYIVFYYTLINNLPDDVICNITVDADDTTLYSKCDQASNLWQQLELASKLEFIYETLWTGTGRGLLISMLKNSTCFI